VTGIKDRWRAGGTTYGVGVTIPGPAPVQLLARAGFDWLMVDMEHGPISIESAHAMIAASAGSGVAMWVRLPEHLPWLAKTVLDAGAAGVVHPQIRTGAEAATAAAAGRYPPAGERQWGPFYAPARFGLSMPDYLRTADDEIVTAVLVEHPDAIERIDEIVAVDGVDVAVIGTHDLAVAMGHRGRPDHPDVRAAAERAEAVIRDSSVVLGGNAFSPDEARAMADRGYQVIALGFDWGLLQRGAAAVLDGLR
jgi:4-hydroxy-2-oxoheptanedioate aldolase